FHYLSKALLQRRYIQLSIEPHRKRDVVSCARRLKLMDEPQPLLRKRQRQIAFPARSLHRRRDRPHPSLLLLHLFRQPSHRRPLEHRSQRYLHLQHFSDPRYHLRRQQRVPSHLEEVFLHSHFSYSQHLAPYPADDLLLSTPRLSLLSLPFFISRR